MDKNKLSDFVNYNHSKSKFNDISYYNRIYKTIHYSRKFNYFNSIYKSRISNESKYVLNTLRYRIKVYQVKSVQFIASDSFEFDFQYLTNTVLKDLNINTVKTLFDIKNKIKQLNLSNFKGR